MSDLEKIIETVQDHERRMDRIDGDIAELKAIQSRIESRLDVLHANVATKVDIARVETSIQRAFVENLKDAQRAIPAHVGAWFAGAMVVLAVASVLVNALR